MLIDSGKSIQDFTRKAMIRYKSKIINQIFINMVCFLLLSGLVNCSMSPQIYLVTPKFGTTINPTVSNFPVITTPSFLLTGSPIFVLIHASSSA